MNTSVEKNSKKRKSIGGQKGTPAKAAKIDESSKAPKSAKSPKVENNVEPNQSVPKNVKSPKKLIAPENKIIKSENGVSPKLKKFKGTKSLEGKSDIKSENSTEEKTKVKKNRRAGKKFYLIEKMKKRVETEGQEPVIKSLNEIIDGLVTKPELSNTGKRNLRMYKHILKIISGEQINGPQPKQKQEKGKKNTEKITAAAAKVKGKTEKKMPVLKAEVKKELKKQKEESEESDDEAEASFEDIKREEFENDSDEEEDESDDEEVEGEGEEESDDDEASDEDEEESGDDDEEDEDEEEEKPTKIAAPKKVIETKNSKPQNQKTEKSEQQSQKKSRYVLFIGNIAYDTTKDELKEHFKKVGEVIDVRIPTDKESNKPRGFAYVELANEAAYQKSLDLNGSQLKNRKIKVEYTQEKKNGEDRTKQMKSKNFKLHAMRKQGQRGSPNKGQNKGSPFKGKNKK